MGRSRDRRYFSAAMSSRGGGRRPSGVILDDAHRRDDILRTLFLCGHPRLTLSQQLALTLRTACGLSPAQVAHILEADERAIQRRIARAEAAVAALDPPSASPSSAERAWRLETVSALLHLMFNRGYGVPRPDAPAARLCVEAIRLARALLASFPTEPEIMGLTARMLFDQARSAARFDSAGGLVLPARQDRALWDRDQISEGLALTGMALRQATPGPHLIAAAIAALHVRAATLSEIEWRRIERLYAALDRLRPSPMTTLERAAAVAEVRGPQAALALLEPLGDALRAHVRFHILRGGLLLRLDRPAEARAAFDRALGLAQTVADAIDVRAQLDGLGADGLALPAPQTRRS